MYRIAGLITLILFSCTTTKKIEFQQNATPAYSMVVQGKTFGTAYMQYAAEYKALCYQSYNIARLRLDAYMQSYHNSDKPLAIITDIDETVLDNSAYEAHQVKQGKDYEASAWYDWTSKASADTIPGATAFLNYAASKRVQIIYITNREEKEKEATIKNLQRFNLPFADNDHVYMRQGSSSKEERRINVMSRWNVVMLIGDNLADFSSLFDKKTWEERNNNVNGEAALFGDKFIVLPNPVYGDWEPALYPAGKWLPTQKDSVIRAKLKSY